MIINYYNFEVNNFKVLQNHIKHNKKVNLLYDIETLTANRKMEKIKPSELQTYTFSFCFSIIDNGKIYLYHFATFYDVITYIKKISNNKKIELVFIAHNNFKYDAHFNRYELIYRLNFSTSNAYVKNITQKIPNVTFLKDNKDNIILEKRVKSSTNLDFTAYYGKMKISNLDTYPRTNSSLRNIGKKLLSLGLIEEQFLKTDFDYLKYDLDEKIINDKHAYKYVSSVFKNLSFDELTYIYNDVIILSLLYLHFEKLYPNFDFSKSTFMQNVKQKYLVNNLASFQIEKSVNNENVYEFSNYKFTKFSLYDYLKKFFRGGLNFYNNFYLNQTVKNMFSIDENSAYPFVMFSEKFPLRIYTHSETSKTVNIFNDSVKNNDVIYYFQFEKEYLNVEILEKIESIVLKQMIVKYYREDVETGKVYISSIILNMLKYDFNIDIDLKKVKCLSYISYLTIQFGARNVINDLYFVKTQGKQKYKLNYNNATDITLSKEKNLTVFTNEDIYISKVYLNGIYGLPALRKYFDYFYISDDNEIFSLNQGFENKERNILFSATVTMYAFRNLITPLKYFKNFIDEFFIYCDTDSLYLKKEAFEYLPSDMFHKMNLGKWDIENELIDNFLVLNHKKYVYETGGKLKIHCAGVPLESFDLKTSFNNFIDKQFSNGVKIKNKKSILNVEKTISIYDSETEFKSGNNYPVYYFSNIDYSKIKEKTLSTDFDSSQSVLYLETPLGAFTKRDFETSNSTHLEDINNLILLESITIPKIIENS